MNNNNQFFDYFKTAMNPEGWANIVKNIPVMDFSSLTNLLKQNVEAATTTNQMVAENMHHMIKKSAETVQHNTHEFLNFVKESINSNDFEQAASKGQHYFKNSLQKSVDTGKEMMDIASKSCMELFSKCSANASENVHNNLNKHKK